MVRIYVFEGEIPNSVENILNDSQLPKRYHANAFRVQRAQYFLLFFSDLLLKYHEQHATARGVLYDTIVLNYTFILISSVNISYKSYIIHLYFVWKNINYVEK